MLHRTELKPKNIRVQTHICNKTSTTKYSELLDYFNRTIDGLLNMVHVAQKGIFEFGNAMGIVWQKSGSYSGQKTGVA